MNISEKNRLLDTRGTPQLFLELKKRNFKVNLKKRQTRLLYF